jgi:methylase of polypeptide subunit release factors
MRFLIPTAPEAGWPKVDVIVGNPPFLGANQFLAVLGDEYVNRLRVAYSSSLPAGANLVLYWFEKAAGCIASENCRRFGYERNSLWNFR